MHLRMIAVAVLTLVPLSGCSRQSSAPMAPPPAASLAVIPADGAAGVRLDAGVQLAFGTPVDRAVVERGFHLISEYDMTSAPCPDSAMGPHGTMSMVMSDSTMVRHMDDFHATGGSFTWNQAGTESAFQPDSMMRPQTRYMVHLGREMVQMMESRMGSMGGMAGHGSGMMAADMMVHFTTMDTTGGGHEGHH